MDFDTFEKMEDSYEHLPLFQRLTTWMYIGTAAGLILLAVLCYKGVSAITYSFKTEEATFQCYEEYTHEDTYISKLTRVTKSNRSRLPRKQTTYNVKSWEVCLERDTFIGLICIDSEMRYNYEVDEFVHYKRITQNHKLFTKDHLLQYRDETNYQIRTSLHYYGKFYNHLGEEQWIVRRKKFERDGTYVLPYYVKSKEIKP